MTPQAPPAGVRTWAPAEDKPMNKQERTRAMFQGRFHGRGGQGVVTAAELLASAAFRDDRYAQAFPSFGHWNTSSQLPKESESWQVPVDAAPTGKRVLVVGAGPSGLSAAYHLARLCVAECPSGAIEMEPEPS
jgi:NADPH-dependent 2,4-dienoyl-CoA reductase/sulfur reductase-like enzyme